MKSNRIVIIYLLIILISVSCVSNQTVALPKENIPQEVESDIYTLIENGDTEAIKKRLDSRDITNQKNALGDFPIHIAVKKKSLEIVMYLVENAGSNIEVQDASGKTALKIALEIEAYDIASYLSKRGSSIWIKDKDGYSSVDLALAKGLPSLKALISEQNVNIESFDNMTILHKTCDATQLEATQYVLSITNSINPRNNNGLTPLDLAFTHPDKLESIKIADLLIAKGGTTSFQDFNYFVRISRAKEYSNYRFDDGSTALHEACKKGHDGIVEFLLFKNVDINSRNVSGSTALHDAVRSGNLESIKILVTHNIDINAKDALENTAIHIEIPKEKRFEIISYLIDHGLDVNLKDKNGNTGLHIASILGYDIPIIKKILDKKNQINSANSSGDTALHIAVSKENIELITLLLSYDASLFLFNAKNETPLTLAFAKNSILVKALINKNTVLKRDEKGNTPLIIASSLGMPISILEIMLTNNAYINAQNNSGDTSMHEAIRNNNTEQGIYLLSKNADIFMSNKKGEAPLSLILKYPFEQVEWFFNSSTVLLNDSIGDSVLHHIVRYSKS